MESFATQEGWESEADMWRFMSKKHRTIRAMACALGVANMTVQRALKRFEIYRKRGRSFSK
jgi:IS30 family transposase